MPKPTVICHMMASVDGKILTANWNNTNQPNIFGKTYEEIHDSFDGDAWICGRVTMEKDFTKGLLPQLDDIDGIVGRDDFVADKKATSFAIAVDAHGKLGWANGYTNGDHIIEVLTEKVADNYIAYLQQQGVSYIFAGKEQIDFNVVLEKLGSLFPISILMLEGGGHLNGSFLNAGLIDELSLLLLPIADGTAKSPTVFEVSDYLTKGPATFLTLTTVKQLQEGIVWLQYKMIK